MAKMQQHELSSTLVKKYQERLIRIEDAKMNAFITELEPLNESNYDRYNLIENASKAFKDLSGYEISECQTLDDFFHPKVIEALSLYIGEDEVNKIIDECKLLIECPYSVEGSYRSSYRSKAVGMYVGNILLHIRDIFMELLFNETLIESLQRGHGNKIRVAFALRRRDPEVVDLVHQAIIGDSSEITLTDTIIRGIMIAGGEQELELLGKLLLAADRQEGIRQSILEVCDLGIIKSHKYFINLILEHDLCRFSSVKRAYETWTSHYFDSDEAMQKVVEKHVLLAAGYLNDEAEINAGLTSHNDDDIYMSLWAMGHQDIRRALTSAEAFIQNPDRHKRLLGWRFIRDSKNYEYAHRLVLNYLHVRDPSELACITGCLMHYATRLNIELHASRFNRDVALHYPKETRESNFYQITEIIKFINEMENASRWHKKMFDTRNLGKALIAILSIDQSEPMMNRFSEMLPLLDQYATEAYYKQLLQEDNPKHRKILFNGLSHKRQYARNEVLKRLEKLTLDDAETVLVAKKLTSTSSHLRKSLMTTLENQHPAQIKIALDTLLAAKNKNQLLAGAELLEINEDLQVAYADKIAEILANKKLAADIRISFAKIVPQEAEKIVYTAENGYGLYNPNMEIFSLEWARKNRPKVPTYNDIEPFDDQLKNLTLPDLNELKGACERLNQVYQENLSYEYEVETWNGGKEKVLLGGFGGIQTLTMDRSRSKGIDNYPLAEKWMQALGDFAVNKQKLIIALNYLIGCLNQHHGIDKKKTLPWFNHIFAGYKVNEEYGDWHQVISKQEENGLHPNTIISIFRAMNLSLEADVFDFVFSIYVNLVNKIPEEKLLTICVENFAKQFKEYTYTAANKREEIIRKPLDLDYFSRWRGFIQYKDESQFKDYFYEMWYQFVASGCKRFYGLGASEIFKAHKSGYLPDEFLHYYFIAGDDAINRMSALTSTRVYQYQNMITDHPTQTKTNYSHILPFLEATIDRIIEIEAKRGELETPLTYIAGNIIKYHGGIEHFVRLLVALGETNFSRGYSYWKSGRYTKQQTLSGLLKACHPREDDTAESLRIALKEAKIAEIRIIQAAIYAPHWAKMLEEAMDITGLTSGVWFFHAHANELFSAEKETEVARYSPITPQQFMDGIFDKDWFLELYEVIGKRRFNILYQNAKYISGSSIHRRSQLYSDAVLGKFDAASLQAEIVHKRNQEKLRAYALIPVEKKQDAVARYEFIQQFLKASKNFGTQRRASENKAVVVALENLAITTGFGDVDRMTWVLEREKMQQLAPLIKPQEVGEYKVWLDITADGTPSVKIRKGEKVLKSIPKAIAKDEHVETVKEAVKSLKQQKKRGKESFENAMIARSEFEVSEVFGLLEHPVLADMVRKLVFVTAGMVGFISIDSGGVVLLGVDGVVQRVEEKKKLRIAHPYDLLEAKVWSEFQGYVFKEKIVQPFKQVFREFYPVTEDELAAGTVSHRYAGHQVQANRAMALFKTRGWTVDYEEGLQRVYHKEDLVVRIHAMADWLSPTDIEPPTLETVEFFRRGKWENVSFSDVDPVIFSEVMRDIDLVVSVAHVGNVDPEASHSTVEMRIAMARELLSLLKIENVTFQAAHAEIKGSLGKYAIHMGSGIAHVMSRGMVSITPIHSQRRGKIFLPFADEDPRTAEVLSKILLLADDKKIKDPTILAQIKG